MPTNTATKVTKKQLKDILSLFGEKTLMTTPPLPGTLLIDPTDQGSEHSSYGYSQYVFYSAPLVDYLEEARENTFAVDYYTDKVKNFLEDHGVAVVEDASLKCLLLKVGVSIIKRNVPGSELKFAYHVSVIDPKSDRKLYDNALYKKDFTSNAYAFSSAMNGVAEMKEILGETSALSPSRIVRELEQTLSELTDTHTANASSIEYNCSILTGRKVKSLVEYWATR